MGSPKKILLATDLSARSDRAMDRATLIAREHAAELVVVHVMEPMRKDWPQGRVSMWTLSDTPTEIPGRLTEIVHRHLAGTNEQLGSQLRVRIESGQPADIILQVSREEDCDLLVVGVARNEFLGRLTLGQTVDRLLPAGEAPLLIVNDRATHPYRHVVVATDLSEKSLVALNTAATLFPGGTLTLFHGRDVPYTSFVSHPASFTASIQESALAETKAFLAAARVSDDIRSRVDVTVRASAPEVHLSQMARDHAVDVVALTTHGRGPVMSALLGSMAKRIVESLSCDALVVRTPGR